MTTQATQFGVNVWWTLPETSVDGLLAQSLLVKHGFEASDMKVPSRQIEVSRAAYSFQDRRSKSNRRVTEKSVHTADSAVYCILDREQTGEDVAFTSHTKVSLDKGSGLVKVDGDLEEPFRKALGEFEGKVTDQDIRYFLRKVIGMCYGIPKRPTGGIYFVPAQFVSVIDQAQELLSELNSGAKIYIERVMDGTQERLNVWESVEADVDDRISKAIASLDQIERLSSAKNKKDDLESASELMKVYQTLLGEEVKYESLVEKYETAVRQVSEKIALIEANKSPKIKSSSTGSGSSSLSVVEIAVKILTESGKPMSYHEIVDEAVKQGLYDISSCKLPYESFVSSIAQSIRKGENKVKRVARGVYGLAA